LNQLHEYNVARKMQLLL